MLEALLGPDMGMAESPPRESAGLLMPEFNPLRMLSPAYEFEADCDRAISRACSTESIHSWVLYLLPAGSEVVARGSSNVKCLSRW